MAACVEFTWISPFTIEDLTMGWKDDIRWTNRCCLKDKVSQFPFSVTGRMSGSKYCSKIFFDIACHFCNPFICRCHSSAL